MKKIHIEETTVHEIREMLNIDDPTWAEIGGEIIKIVDVSNTAYGDSTIKSCKILEILWPNGIPAERYHDARCMISVLDKLARIAQNKDAFGESPWRDIAGYAFLAYRAELQSNPNRER